MNLSYVWYPSPTEYSAGTGTTGKKVFATGAPIQKDAQNQKEPKTNAFLIFISTIHRFIHSPIGNSFKIGSSYWTCSRFNSFIKSAVTCSVPSCPKILCIFLYRSSGRKYLFTCGSGSSRVFGRWGIFLFQCRYEVRGWKWISVTYGIRLCNSIGAADRFYT